MLKIQEFIKAHDNWEELLSNAPYNLKISWDDDFVLFKYSQIDSDFNEEICREARGLILDARDDFKVVRYAFKKFFNLDEGYADSIDWDTAVATEKIDGSIMSAWYARGEWHLSTNGKIDAFKAELSGAGPYKTFGELFESVLPLYNFKSLSGNYCYTFELVSPYNKVVIDYPETKVYLLSIRNLLTFEEVPEMDMMDFSAHMNVDRPQGYNLNNENDYRQLVASMPEGHEGIVVRDAAGNRVKIKTLLYFEMHKAKNNGVITLERIVDLIRSNDHYEFLSYFPEYTDVFNHVKHQLDTIDARKEKIVQDVNLWKMENKDVYEQDARMARKWFAQDVAKGQYAALYFAAYDNHLNETIASMRTDQLIRAFNIKED